MFVKLFNMQPKLFENTAETVDIGDVILYALGDFQSRGKVLANRELALDRLHGAFHRAFVKFGIAESTDERIVEILKSLGARVVTVPNFVAKYPYRVTVSQTVAANALEAYNRKIAV